MRTKIADTFRSLRVRNYRLFVGGQIVSLIGTWMQFIAQDWLVLQLSNDSGTALGVVLALQFTPVLLLSLYGGKLADRHDKRRLIIIANATWAVLAFTLGLLVVTGTVQLWHVFVFAASFGTVSALEVPTRQAFVSELVGTKLLPNALSLNAAVFNTARIVGPAIAGLLIAWLDTGPVIMLNTLTYLAPLAAMLMINPATLNRAAIRPRTARISDGLAYVRRRPDLLLPLALVLVIGGLGFNFQITLALLSKTEFGRGAASFGLLSSALALGALAGAFAGTGRRGRPSVYVLIGGALAFGVLELAVGFSPTYLTAAVLLLAVGFTMIYFAQAANQRVQLGTEPEYRGRVMSLYVMVFLGSNPVCAPLVGWLSERYGARAGLWLGGVAALLAAVSVLVVRSRRRHVRWVLHARPRPHLHLVEPEARAIRIPALRVAVESERHA
ncbi:MAG: MFS transporter, partial [Micromonosporaceae bacterium]|nr:MFS transporter [Micromonosporaceae bacterium]